MFPPDQLSWCFAAVDVRADIVIHACQYVCWGAACASAFPCKVARALTYRHCPCTSLALASAPAPRSAQGCNPAHPSCLNTELSWTALWPRTAPRPGQQPDHQVCVQDQWQAHLAARASPAHMEAPGQAREPQLPKAKAALVAAEANQAVGGEPSETNPSRLAADHISADLDRAQSRPQVPLSWGLLSGARGLACSFVQALALAC